MRNQHKKYIPSTIIFFYKNTIYLISSPMYTTIQYHLFFNNFILTENFKKISSPATLFIYGVSFNTWLQYIYRARMLCYCVMLHRCLECDIKFIFGLLMQIDHIDDWNIGLIPLAYRRNCNTTNQHVGGYSR